MDAHQKSIRERVRAVVDATGMNLTQLARKAGLSHTTLTRFMNNPDVTHALSSRTLAKIASIGSDIESALSPPTATSMPDVTSRMRSVRQAMAAKYGDDQVAHVLGWDLDRLHEILNGESAPTLQELIVFCARMRVTTDFVLTGGLEGLSRAAERLLLAVDPDLGSHINDMGLSTGKDPA